MEDGISCFKAFNACEFPVCTALGDKAAVWRRELLFERKEGGIKFGFYLCKLMLIHDTSRYVSVSDVEVMEE